MARVTVEDCVDKVPNRFELVLLSAHRARAMSAGAELTVERDNDKNPVVALREIAEKTVMPDELREDLIGSLQSRVETEEPEVENMQLLMSGEATGEVQDTFGATEDGGERMSEEDLLRAIQSQIDLAAAEVRRCGRDGRGRLKTAARAGSAAQETLIGSSAARPEGEGRRFLFWAKSCPGNHVRTFAREDTENLRHVASV